MFRVNLGCVAGETVPFTIVIKEVHRGAWRGADYASAEPVELRHTVTPTGERSMNSPGILREKMGSVFNLNQTATSAKAM